MSIQANLMEVKMDKYTLNRENTLLLIIDIQERLAPVVRQEKEVIENNKILIKTANTLNIPIIVTEQYPKGLGPTVREVKDSLQDAKIFEKISFTACTEEVMESLEGHGRKKIIITGMETHVCVFQTARDLLDKGYQVFLVADGVSSRTKENYKNSLELMRDMGALISNTETIVFDLLKKAGTPEFKALSKLIK